MRDIVQGVRSAMASICLQPPSPFDFKTPDEWPRWKRRFEQFRLASDLADENDDRQVSTLLYCMGEAAEDILASTNIAEADWRKYGAVIKQYDDFFHVQKNIIFERARFNRYCQAVSESVEQFITSLYTLVESCNYGDLKDQMIRDRIVVGIRDQAQSERLQMDAGLTLEKAKTLVRQREAVQEQQILLKHGQKEDKSIDFLRQGVPSKGKVPLKNRSQAPAKKPRQMQSKRSQCGRGPHTRQQCPAKDAACHNYKRKGHYSAQCFTRQLQRSPHPQSRMWQTTTM